MVKPPLALELHTRSRKHALHKIRIASATHASTLENYLPRQALEVELEKQFSRII